MKKNKKDNKLTITIIVVAIIVVAIASGTYAYWQWISTNTTVTFTTPEQSTMTINGGGNITTKTLAPANCYNTTYAIQRKVKVSVTNTTTTAMQETLELKVNAFSKGHGTDAQFNTAKSSVKWALVRSDSTQHAANTWLLTTSAGCNTAASTSTNETTLHTKGTMLATGTFSGLAADSVITVYTKDIAAAKSTGSASNVVDDDYYELYIWIDPAYVGQPTVGTTVNDPLQDMTLNLQWQGSITNQPG